MDRTQSLMDDAAHALRAMGISEANSLLIARMILMERPSHA